MTHPRRPCTTAVSRPLPTLAALVAGGALVMACHEPACGDHRGTELRVHGVNASREFKGHDYVRSAQELAVAVGVWPHPTPSPAGAVPLVTPSAEVSATAVVPPPVVITPPVNVMGPHGPLRGGMRSVTHTPATAPRQVRPPPRRPVPHAEPNTVVGAMGAITTAPMGREPV